MLRRQDDGQLKFMCSENLGDEVQACKIGLCPKEASVPKRQLGRITGHCDDAIENYLMGDSSWYLLKLCGVYCPNGMKMSLSRRKCKAIKLRQANM